MNVVLPKGDGSRSGDNLKPGEWGVTEDGHIMVRCVHVEHPDGLPRLGIIRYAAGTFAGADTRSWAIDALGNVTPSIFSMNNGCGWHVFARLDGWSVVP